MYSQTGGQDGLQVRVYSQTGGQDALQVRQHIGLSLEEAAGAVGDGYVTRVLLQRRVVGVL